ncbi:DUF2569 family protein [Adhaeribacter sp. BT258]|uniref:DUF2569 family protein n=1 Tax=Adhaeribacter terrigena TaxID=2793070 RepID=A0ABS1C668_9BACT|nr:DUF2569 family protein [Adhaeribacter terrigena]MBK0404798.1 DUF2569 family protein [Adhaeribacter terrigena]
MIQEISLQENSQKKGKPITGWLWLVGISMIASLLTIIISLTTTITEFLQDDWQQYFQTTDNLLKIRISIYLYLIIAMVVSLIILIWTLKSFFQRRKAFINLFLGLIGYSILTEIIRILLLEYYAGLTGQDASTLESNLVKIIIVGSIAGIYLNKGKNPQQTFVK